MNNLEKSLEELRKQNLEKQSVISELEQEKYKLMKCNLRKNEGSNQLHAIQDQQEEKKDYRSRS